MIDDIVFRKAIKIVRQPKNEGALLTTQPAVFGSDIAADLLRAFDLPYVSINPGASFRGLHDSLVNHLGNERPKMLVTLHEAQAVAIAHGYAKVSGKPMGVILHANVGLMNAVMSIYNAFVDRVPMLIIGATGAVDAAKRRPWIEWIHTSRDQAAMVRPFLKWDDQPASVEAMVEAMLRAWAMINTSPHGPAYICLDVTMQEAETDVRDIPKLDKFGPWIKPNLTAEALEASLRLIAKARKPLILVGRYGKSDNAWRNRIAFAEKTGAAVICDQKVGIGFPSKHPNFVAAPAQYPDNRTAEIIGQADLVINLDWGDPSALYKLRGAGGQDLATLLVSEDERLHNGWSFDHFPFLAADQRLSIAPDVFIAQLLDTIEPKPFEWQIPSAAPVDVPVSGAVTVPALVAAVERARGITSICYTRMAFGTPDALLSISSPLDLIGYDGGGGIGSTPGITVGVALALKGSGRLPVAIIGDGDLLMGSQALWTAANQKLPCLFIVNNNASFYNDVEHQEVVARHRGRAVENKLIGMEIDNPKISLVGLAGSYGFETFGPSNTIEELDSVLLEAFAAAHSGACVLVDVVTLPPAPRKA